MKKIIVSLISLFSCLSIFAQAHLSQEPHQASVTTILPVPKSSSFDSYYFSAGEDGFLIKWGDEGEHYQISDVGIKNIAVSPDGNLIAVYETDGGSVNKVSVWDWRNFTRKFNYKYSDSITSLQFSAKGTYLIIGTATVNGLDFVRTSDWRRVSKIKTTTGIANYILTSDSEKTCILYSPSGNLSYFNMQTGQLKEKLSISQGLSQTVLFNNAIFFGGVKDNTIYVYNAFKGTNVSSIPAKNPIILSTPSETNLYYLEYDGKNNYELKMLEAQENMTLSNPRIIKTLKGPRGNDSIKAGIKHYSEIVLGGGNGAVYKIDDDPSITVNQMTEISNREYSKIYSMTPYEKDFLFLTDKSIYKSSYDSGIVDKLCSSSGETDIIDYDKDNVILWSKASKNEVSLLNLNTKVKQTLFTPNNSIQSLKLCSIGEKKYLVEIESNTIINIFDFTNKTFKTYYTGTGIQDAILADDGNLYIAKTASSSPYAPLIAMNIDTYETIPLSINGNVSYGLSTDGTIIYGLLLINNNGTPNTYVFSYNTKSKRYSNLLQFSEEDSDAFTYLYNGELYTNIGKNKVYTYNMNTKKRFSYNRSASIPSAICQNGSRVVILNKNGSISWCNNTSANLIGDWYLTLDEQWFSF